MNFYSWVKSNKLDRDSCNQFIHGWTTFQKRGIMRFFSKFQNSPLKVDQEKRTTKDFKPGSHMS